MSKLHAFWLSVLVCNLILVFVAMRDMMAMDYYQFLPIIFLAEGLLLFFRWDREFRWPTSILSQCLIGLGLLVSLLSLPTGSSRLATLGFIAFAGAWLSSHRQENGKSLVALWPPLWLLFRLPSELESSLVFGLQEASSYMASSVLDLIGITHYRQGNIIELPAGELFVEEACSGVQSTFTLIFCAAFLVPLFHRSLWLLPIYVATSALWAVLLNLTRIVVIALGLDWFQVDLANGWQHEVLGYCCLFLAIVFLLSTDRLLAVVFFPVPASNFPLGGYNPINRVWNYMFSLPKEVVDNLPDFEGKSVAEARVGKTGSMTGAKIGIGNWMVRIVPIFAGLVLLGQLYVFATSFSPKNAGEKLSVAWRPSAELLKDLVPGLEVIGHKQTTGSINMPFGQLSDIWECRYNNIPVQIALSQPYPEWHDLRVCYKATAWRLLDGLTVSDPNKPGWGGVRAEFLDAKDNYGTVFFSGVTADRGEPLDAPASGWTESIKRLVERNVGRRVGFAQPKAAMIQLFVVTEGKMSQTLQEAFQQLHWVSRERIREALSAAASNMAK